MNSRSEAFEVLQPAGWERPKGYSNGIAARGRQVYIAGQVGWDVAGRFPATLAEQVGQALANILAILAVAGGKPGHIVRLTWFITSREEYYAELPAIGAAYRAQMGKNFPTMSVVQVAALIEAGAKLEIEATAVLPDS